VCVQVHARCAFPSLRLPKNSLTQQLRRKKAEHSLAQVEGMQLPIQSGYHYAYVLKMNKAFKSCVNLQIAPIDRIVMYH